MNRIDALKFYLDKAILLYELRTVYTVMPYAVHANIIRMYQTAFYL